MTIVVLGPRTRLGEELIARALGRGETVLAVSRHARDDAALATSGATVVRHDQVATVVPAGPVRLLICALGPVQSEDHVETADVERDLAVVEAVLERTTQAHVVLISSVLALAPKADRRRYAGWKCLVEDRVRAAAVRRRASLAVFYPGRLVEGTKSANPKSWMHTRYQKLGRVVDHSEQPKSLSRVVGLDARLWLGVRGLQVVASAVSGSGGLAARQVEEPKPPDSEPGVDPYDEEARV